MPRHHHRFTKKEEAAKKRNWKYSLSAWERLGERNYTIRVANGPNDAIYTISPLDDRVALTMMLIRSSGGGSKEISPSQRKRVEVTQEPRRVVFIDHNGEEHFKEITLSTADEARAAAKKHHDKEMHRIKFAPKYKEPRVRVKGSVRKGEWIVGRPGAPESPVKK